MTSNNNSNRSSNTSSKATGNADVSENSVKAGSQSSIDSTKDYISGDSTPSSSSHQFPWIATDPKHDSKKSAQKQNS
ncbi:MAG TPA: hypothetical protein VN258_19765 [Mobilitalea sp.]|nr:hypothetical protein [Mobilitalea sp.]